MQKFRDNQVATFFIAEKDSDIFLDYCANRIVDLTDPDSMLSETEKAKQLQAHVGGMIHSLFSMEHDSDNENDELLKQAFSIVDRLVGSHSRISLSQLLNQYFLESRLDSSHAASVSSLATLLSISTGMGDYRNLALAGLFHDVALVENQVTTVAYFQAFHQHADEIPDSIFNHPLEAVDLLRTKKILLNREVVEIIEQHHEKFDGSGYPRALAGDEITVEAQILHIADRIVSKGQYLEGHSRQSPAQVIEIIEAEGAVRPDLFGCVKKLFSDI